MRTSIVLWSAASGALIGVLADALLVGVVLLTSAVVPVVGNRLTQRGIGVAAIILLGAIPLTLGFLGALEGCLKAK